MSIKADPAEFAGKRLLVSGGTKVLAPLATDVGDPPTNALPKKSGFFESVLHEERLRVLDRM